MCGIFGGLYWHPANLRMIFWFFIGSRCCLCRNMNILCIQAVPNCVLLVLGCIGLGLVEIGKYGWCSPIRRVLWYFQRYQSNLAPCILHTKYILFMTNSMVQCCFSLLFTINSKGFKYAHFFICTDILLNFELMNEWQRRSSTLHITFLSDIFKYSNLFSDWLLVWILQHDWLPCNM